MIFSWKDKSDEQVVRLIESQQTAMENVRSNYDDLHATIVKVFRPRRYNILGNYKMSGHRYGAKVYDQHPANALRKHVHGFLGYMISKSIPWLQFEAPRSDLMRVDRIKKYCQNAAEQVLYGLRRSTLYTASTPHALDANSIGTSCMIPWEDSVKDRIVFDVVHPRDSFIACDTYGDVAVYHRTLSITRLSAVQIFGRDNLPAAWFKDNDVRDMLTQESFLWCVYPNDDRYESSVKSTDKPYRVFCVYKGGRGRNKSRLVYNSGRYLPVICWRSMRESGASYGTSIAADCLTSGLVVNKLGEKAVKAAHLAVEPVIVAPQTVRASLRRSGLNPNSRIYVDDMLREKPQTLLDRLNWPITDAQMKQFHEYIDEAFSIRFFELLTSIDRRVKTAYEVSQMMAEKAANMTQITGDYERDSLEPSVSAVIYHETVAGRMPDVPDELVSAGGEVLIKYLGPLDQLQRTLLQTRPLVDGLSIIMQMAALDETVKWKYNLLEASEEATMAQGWPQRLVRTDEEVETIRQQVAADRAAMQQTEMMEKAAKATSLLGKRTDASSPLQQLASSMKST